MIEEPIVCQCCMRVSAKDKMATKTCCKQCDDEDNLQRHLSGEVFEHE